MRFPHNVAGGFAPFSILLCLGVDARSLDSFNSWSIDWLPLNQSLGIFRSEGDAVEVFVLELACGRKLKVLLPSAVQNNKFCGWIKTRNVDRTYHRPMRQRWVLDNSLRPSGV